MPDLPKTPVKVSGEKVGGLQMTHCFVEVEVKKGSEKDHESKIAAHLARRFPKRKEPSFSMSQTATKSGATVMTYMFVLICDPVKWRQCFQADVNVSPLAKFTFLQPESCRGWQALRDDLKDKDTVKELSSTFSEASI